MIGITNAGGSNVVAFLNCTYEAGSVCVATNGTKTIRATDTSGFYLFKLTSIGEWTITITKGDQRASETISVIGGTSAELYLSYRVPAGYKEVEYITSAGNNFINTGITAGYIKIITEFMYASTSSFMSVFGRQNTSAGAGQYFFTYNNNYVMMVYQTNVTIGSLALNTWHTLEWEVTTSKLSSIVDGTEYSQSVAKTGIEGSYPLALFGINSAGTYGYGLDGSLKETSIYDSNGDLLRHYIPCRRVSDGVVGMYDDVSETFTSGEGAGTFTAGPDVSV